MRQPLSNLTWCINAVNDTVVSADRLTEIFDADAIKPRGRGTPFSPPRLRLHNVIIPAVIFFALISAGSHNRHGVG